LLHEDGRGRVFSTFVTVSILIITIIVIIVLVVNDYSSSSLSSSLAQFIHFRRQRQHCFIVYFAYEQRLGCRKEIVRRFVFILLRFMHECIISVKPAKSAKVSPYKHVHRTHAFNVKFISYRSTDKVQ